MDQRRKHKGNVKTSWHEWKQNNNIPQFMWGNLKKNF